MSSHVRVNKYKVQKAVAAMIKENIANNKEQLECLINDVMNAGWKIFKPFRPKTREAAIKKIEANIFLVYHTDITGKLLSYQLRPISAMCDVAEEDYVMLSKEDCNVLRKYFD